MSESIGSIGSDIATHPILVPQPSGPPTGTLTASMPNDSTTTEKPLTDRSPSP